MEKKKRERKRLWEEGFGWEKRGISKGINKEKEEEREEDIRRGGIGIIERADA